MLNLNKKNTLVSVVVPRTEEKEEEESAWQVIRV